MPWGDCWRCALERSRIVDQHIDAVVPFGQLVRNRCHGIQVTQVGQRDMQVVVARRGRQFPPRPLGTCGVATHQHERRSQLGQFVGRRPADARGCAGQHHDPTRHVVADGLPPVGARPDVVAEPGEARHDRQLDRSVDDVVPTHQRAVAAVPEDVAQTRGGPVADPTEGHAECRIQQAQGPGEPEVGVVGDRCTAAGFGHDGDAVLGGEHGGGGDDQHVARGVERHRPVAQRRVDARVADRHVELGIGAGTVTDHLTTPLTPGSHSAKLRRSAM